LQGKSATAQSETVAAKARSTSWQAMGKILLLAMFVTRPVTAEKRFRIATVTCRSCSCRK
jgi:hypothetical protein